MITRRKNSSRTASLFCLLIFALTACSPEAAKEPATLDLTQPVPREQVLDLFRQLFALPAEDYLNWDESVAAGKIPPDVQAFHEHIIAYNEEARIDPAELSTEGLPFIELAEGPPVYPVLKASLGPKIGANVSQEDLNSLLPDLADIQKRIWELQEREAEEIVFTKVRLKPEDFGIARVHESATPDTVEMKLAQAPPSATPFHVERTAAIDGRHIQGARVSTRPFVSVHVELTEEGGETLTRITEESAGITLAVIIGGELRSAVAIGGTMQTRHLQLPAAFTEEDANRLIESWTKASPP